jgi:hypothetical protein
MQPSLLSSMQNDLTVDIETMLPWQKNIFDQIAVGGTKAGEMMIISAGRQVGKSMFTQQAIERLMRDLNSQPVSDLVQSEGRVYGARYYCVEPVGGNWREMEDWCISTYGSSTGSIWAQEVDKSTPLVNERWYANNRKFWFRNERDRDWFIIKWRA